MVMLKFSRKETMSANTETNTLLSDDYKKFVVAYFELIALEQPIEINYERINGCKAGSTAGQIEPRE